MPQANHKPTALPMSRAEMSSRGWTELDVLLVTGDAYVDHPSFGPAVIGRVLEAAGYRVGIAAQPDWRNAEALKAMGRPRLFVGVTAGNLDSMLSNYTAARHKRKDDDFSPGGKAGLRPNHACVVYAQLARQAFPGVTVVLGGIEASMRRVAHYDYWEDKLRPSILMSSKADLLVYGMGEAAVVEIARRLEGADAQSQIADSRGKHEAGNSKIENTAPDLAGIRGTAVLLGAGVSKALKEERSTLNVQRSTFNGKNEGDGSVGSVGSVGSGRLFDCSTATPPHGHTDFIQLPSWEELQADPKLLLKQTKLVEAEASPFCGRRLVQFHGERALVVEPPAFPATSAELDRVYELPYTRLPHPSYREPVPAFTMIKDSVTVVRGCPGGCSFCGLGLHQGKFLASRSKESVLRELRTLTAQKTFHGTVTDLGGPTANLYGCHNGRSDACRVCRRPSCLFPEICPRLETGDAAALALLRSAREVPGVKHVFVQSGIRMDVALRQPAYLRELIRKHVSGHLKIAPEHLDPEVLRRMRKPRPETFTEFLELFTKESAAAGKEQYTVPYFISSFPGCTERHMATVERFLKKSRWNLQQVQDYIPLPMTAAAAMYVTGLDYETEKPITVARNASERERQRAALRPPAGRS